MWNFLLRGAGIFDKTELPPKPEFLATVSQDAWELLVQLSKYSYPPRMVQPAAVDVDNDEEQKEPSQQRQPEQQ